MMSPRVRGGLRNRLRRTVERLGGLTATSERTGLAREEVLACVGYRQQRPSDAQLRLLAIRLASAGVAA